MAGFGSPILSICALDDIVVDVANGSDLYIFDFRIVVEVILATSANTAKGNPYSVIRAQYALRLRRKSDAAAERSRGIAQEITSNHLFLVYS